MTVRERRLCSRAQVFPAEVATCTGEGRTGADAGRVTPQLDADTWACCFWPMACCIVVRAQEWIANWSDVIGRPKLSKEKQCSARCVLRLQWRP